MFFWARLTGAGGKERDAAEFSKRAIDKLMVFVPGAPFYGNNPERATFRLNFAAADVAKIGKAGEGIVKPSKAN